MSINSVTLFGNVGKDPEVRYMPNGDPVCNFSVATNRKWKDKAGEPQEEVEWHNIVFFGRAAEIAGEYLKRGSQVIVRGRLRTRKYTNKDGVEMRTTEIVGDLYDGLQLVGGRQAPKDDGDAEPTTSAGTKSNTDALDSDIPF